MSEELNEKEQGTDRVRGEEATPRSDESLRTEYLGTPYTPTKPVPIELACRLPGLEVNENQLAHLVKPMSEMELEVAANQFVTTVLKEGDDFGNTKERKELEELLERAIRSRDEQKLLDEINETLAEIGSDSRLQLEKGKTVYANSPGCYPANREIMHYNLKLVDGCNVQDLIECAASRPVSRTHPPGERPKPRHL